MKTYLPTIILLAGVLGGCQHSPLAPTGAPPASDTDPILPGLDAPAPIDTAPPIPAAACGGELPHDPNSGRDSRNRVIDWSGYRWTVRSSLGAQENPDRNVWSNSRDSVWVDPSGCLHLTIRQGQRNWLASEVFLQQSLGYGRYTFVVDGGTMDYARATLGMFVYDASAPSQGFREIDIEVSRWGLSGGPNVQYVVQPKQLAGVSEFDVTGRPTSHAFWWRPGHVVFQSGYDSMLTVTREVRGAGVQTPGREIASINLWTLIGRGAPTGPMEMVLRQFQFQKE